MNKTIFNLNGKMSIIIVACLGILLGFLSNAYYVSDFLDFILYIFRGILFIGIYLAIYSLEKNDLGFKSTNKRMLGYLSCSYLLNTICALFAITHILSQLFLVISGIVCFWVILVFIFEVLCLYFENKWIVKINKFNEKIGLLFANPIVRLLEKKTTND